jgi:hypothetical protein
MSVNYLLECQDCGKSVAVPERRAGETIPCDCGSIIAVPALRELRSCPVDESESTSVPARSSWSYAQGIVFVAGLVTTLVAVTAIWYIVREQATLRQMDHLVDRFLSAQDLEQMSSDSLFEGWDTFRTYGLDFSHTPDFENLQNRERTMWVYQIATGLLTVVGASLLVCSFVLRH